MGNYFRTGNAANKFRQVGDYAGWRFRGLMVKKRDRNLHAGQAAAWTEDWFNGYVGNHSYGLRGGRGNGPARHRAPDYQ